MAMLRLRATSTFWFYSENRHVYQGEEFDLPAERFPEYELVAKELVSGKLPTGRPPSFREKLVEKAGGAVAAAKVALGLADSTDRFICQHCQQVFKAQRGLEIHLRNAHPPKTEEAPKPDEESPKTEESPAE